MARPFSPDLLVECIRYMHDRFDERGLWHCLAYGTLLGAIREQDVIAWDYDFDFFVRPSEVDEILALAPTIAADGFELKRMWIYESLLAVNPERLGLTRGCSLGVYYEGNKLGDLYAYPLFADGILRRFDTAQDVYWLPHSSVPHFYFERLEQAPIRDVQYPIPQHADRFIAGVYGEDWRTPYRAERQGGSPREGATTYGDRFAPKLEEEIAWCVAQGWDRSKYRHEMPWPRPFRASGPTGTDPRTADGTTAWWWRDRDELIRYY